MRKLLQWSWWTGSVSRRICVITLLTMALTAAVAFVSLRGLHTLNSELDRTVREHSQAATLVGAMLQASQRLSDRARLAASAPTPEARDAALAQLEASKKALGERVDEISARMSNAPELQKALQEGFSSLMKAGGTEEAERQLLTSFDSKLLSYVSMTINGISERTGHSVQAAAATGHGAYNRTLGLLLPILFAVGAGLIVSHLLLRWTVIKPVQRVARAAEQLAQGSLDIDLTSTSRDECGHMLHAMSSLRGQLASMIDAISFASSTVASTADALAEDNHDLSSRTNEQARAFRDASQALEVLNVMAQTSAEGARQVSADMQQAFSSAERGNAVIVQAVATIQTTAEACRRIAATVGMIDEIAFKTNILALNAAVEAARAGEHGRSFAVVAAEVRELAGKSATAAKEIASLIDGSVEAVTQGSRLVGEAGAAMETIVRQVREATGRVADISAASCEQSKRAGQVANAMSAINSGTQRNAGMVSQAAASTEALRNEARALMSSVGEFAQHGAAAAA